MNILMLCEHFPGLTQPIFSGGVETRCYFTALNLAKQNQIYVVAHRKQKQKKVEKTTNLVVYRVGIPISSEVANLKSLINRLQFVFFSILKSLELQIDLVEGSNFITFMPAFLVGLIKNIPKVAWYPDTLIDQWHKNFGIILGSLGDTLDRFYLRLPWDKLIVISDSTNKKLLLQGVLSKRIKTIYCGIDIHFSKQKKIAKKNQLIVVSRLVKYKRVEWAIKLHHYFHKRKKTQQLIIVGKGPQLVELKKLIRDLRVSKSVFFRYELTQKELNSLISQSKLLLHPSAIEGFGIVLVESAFLGTPHIASDIPALKEVNHSLQSGLLFQKHNFNDFIKKAEELLSNEEFYQKLSRNGLKNSLQFDWEILTKKVEKEYKKLVY